jgi:hypothetical protein
MNAAGDYSAAYCILHTDSEFEGHGMVGFCFLYCFVTELMGVDLKGLVGFFLGK